MDLSSLTVDELDLVLVELAHAERAALRRFLEHLIEFTRKRGPERKAYPSLYAYCRYRLKLSDGESYRRMQVSYAAAEIPLILDHIGSGGLNLTTASLLVPHLTAENAQDFIAKADGKSRRDVEALVAALSTKEPSRDVIRMTPAAPAPKEPVDPLFAAPALPAAAPAAVQPALPAPSTPPPEPTVRIGFTASRELLEKLERAKGLLRHKHPDGRLEHVFDEALEALLDRIDRGRKETPAKPKPVLPGRRRIPEWVKDEVWRRDGGRCAFQRVDGKRCAAAEWLEYDHIQPFALGGLSDDPDNVRLLCRAHNQHRAREDFGDAIWSGGGFEPAA